MLLVQEFLFHTTVASLKDHVTAEIRCVGDKAFGSLMAHLMLCLKKLLYLSYSLDCCKNTVRTASK